MAYNPSNAFGTSLDEIREWVQKELQKIQQEFVLQDFIRLKTMNAPPKKVFDGLTVLADGTDWNPGSGQGVYTYYNATWHKLG